MFPKFVLSIVPLGFGFYRASGLKDGIEFSVVGISHTDALERAFAKFIQLEIFS